MIITPNWPAPKNIKACTTTRLSWDNDYHSLKTVLNLPADPAWINQTHTNIVTHADQAANIETADASYTTKPNQICVVRTADCLPILITNKTGTVVAAIHAGWRGLANGIIEATLSELNQPSENLLIWLGPAIGPQKFEVGQDVYDAFTQQHPNAATAFAPTSKHKWLANLYQLATLRLHEQGITNIFGAEFCTHSQSDLFYSYRRDGKTGRMASLIWISPD